MRKDYSGFVRRLHEALDKMGVAKGRRRGTALARALVVMPSEADAWLSGRELPPADRWVRIALYLGVDPHWLFAGINDIGGVVRRAAVLTEAVNANPLLRELLGTPASGESYAAYERAVREAQRERP